MIDVILDLQAGGATKDERNPSAVWEVIKSEWKESKKKRKERKKGKNTVLTAVYRRTIYSVIVYNPHQMAHVPVRVTQRQRHMDRGRFRRLP